MARDYLVFVTEEIIHSNLSKILWLDFICSPCEKLVKSGCVHHNYRADHLEKEDIPTSYVLS